MRGDDTDPLERRVHALLHLRLPKLADTAGASDSTAAAELHLRCDGLREVLRELGAPKRRPPTGPSASGFRV